MKGKDRAYWLADKIPAYGDYAKEAALVLCQQADEIERLRDALRLAADEPNIDKARARDADRYRWLRAQHWNDNTIAAVRWPKDAMKLGHDAPSGERLDDLIDAAMTG